MRPRQAAPSRVLYRLVAVSVTIVAVWASGACERNDTQRVEFWTISLRPTFTDYIESRVDAFEAEHPGVDVVWVDVPFMAVERKFIAAAAAGRAPDVINLSDMMFARFAAAGAFVDLTLTLPDGAESAYHPGALRIGRLSGGLYALPWYLTTQATMSNAALLEKGGLSPDDLGSTWGDLMARAEVFHDRTGVSLFTQPLGQDSQLPMMLIADGGPPSAPGRTANSSRISPARGCPRIPRRVGPPLPRGVLPRECVTRGFEHLIDVYQDERVAALVTGVNFLGRIRDTARTVYDETEVRPAITGTLGRAHIAVMPVGVTSPVARSRTRHRLRPAHHQRREPGRILPPRDDPAKHARGVLETRISTGRPVRARGGPREGGAQARALGRRDHGRRRALHPAVECWPDLRRSFEAGMKRVLLDGADLGETLARTQREWQGIIDEMNARRAAAGAGPPSTTRCPPAPKKPAAADNGTREGS
jgi:putative chitobiose transport system substrate-binding protein